MTENAGPLQAEQAWQSIFVAAEQHGQQAASRMSFRPATLSFNTADTSLVMEQLLTAPARPLAETFELLDKLGEGGMGVVMRARQAALERDVAVKQLVVVDDAHRLAFLSEAQIMGRLDHANIVPVHTLVSGQGGAPLLAMKLIEGATWSAHIHQRETSLDEHLRIFEAVCNAVAFAHSRDIIHRDLKPDNVAIGSFGQVYVMDWGVSAALTEQACRGTAIFLVNEVPGPVGTPCYMSPELAAGDASKQDARTDVYLLGACLHEALTRTRRHQGSSMQALREAALRSTPPRYGAQVPSELAEICRRAMAAEPTSRFGSVAELMLALEAYREHAAARALIADGMRLSEQLTELLDSAPFTAAQLSADQDARDQHDGSVETLYNRASYALEHALQLWPEAPARGPLHALHTLMFDRTLAREELGPARRLALLLGSDEARERVDALQQRAQARQQELTQLRLAQQRRNWDLVARPLGSCYLFSASLGALAALLSLWARGLDKDQLVAAVGLSWLTVLLGSGGFALVRLRQVTLPGYLISPRAFGSWAAVGVAIGIHGLFGVLRDIVPFHDSDISSLFLAVGFAASAFQTRYWLLLPAAAWFGGALLMGATVPEANMPIFGLLWTLTLGGVGLALLKGARLDPEQAEAAVD